MTSSSPRLRADDDEKMEIIKHPDRTTTNEKTV